MSVRKQHKFIIMKEGEGKPAFAAAGRSIFPDTARLLFSKSGRFFTAFGMMVFALFFLAVPARALDGTDIAPGTACTGAQEDQTMMVNNPGGSGGYILTCDSGTWKATISGDTPTSNEHLTTKEYVDTAVAGGGCPVFETTYFSVGGNTRYCQKETVDANGEVTASNINENHSCDTGKLCDDAGACVDYSGNSCSSVGDLCSDGTVYVDGTIYAMPYDLSGSSYWGAYNFATGSTSTSDGQGNHADVYAHVMAGDGINNPDDGIVPNAFVLCNDTTYGGHSDWYVPASDELVTLYTNKDAIGNFWEVTHLYWSSTEVSTYNANTVSVSNGSPVSTGKNNPRAVRCIRKN